MNKKGKILSEDRINNTKEEIRTYLASLPADSQVVLEATNNWYAFVEWSHDLPLEIKLAHPAKTKAIASARIKTDSIDSKILADLLRSNFIAESYLAPKEIRDVRELVRFRTSLSRTRAQFQTRIRSVLFKNGERIEAKSVLSQRGRKELMELELRPVCQKEIRSCLQTADALTEQIELFNKMIVRQATVDKDTQLLMTIPGISFFSALLITSEIGDYRRFRSSRKLCCWAGLVPSVYSSGGKTRRGRIIKQGSKNLRFVLLQAVPHAIKKSSWLQKIYLRVAKKHGKRTAKIAVARKLLSIILTMLKQGQPFKVNYQRAKKLPASCYSSRQT